MEGIVGRIVDVALVNFVRQHHEALVVAELKNLRRREDEGERDREERQREEGQRGRDREERQREERQRGRDREERQRGRERVRRRRTRKAGERRKKGESAIGNIRNALPL